MSFFAVAAIAIAIVTAVGLTGLIVAVRRLGHSAHPRRNISLLIGSAGIAAFVVTLAVFGMLQVVGEAQSLASAHHVQMDTTRWVIVAVTGLIAIQLFRMLLKTVWRSLAPVRFLAGRFH